MSYNHESAGGVNYIYGCVLKGTVKAVQYVDKQLSRHEWFHGVVPRSDCEEMLKSNGDFLVRKTSVAGVTKYCISARYNNDTKHIPVTYAKKTWSLLNVSRHL
ncbi:SH2 domain protein [Oesophagostomum dentatum]|uniref:SH2 domain protein n=1 Tax=Oesophagostomum dentatum TaxID=61180 RepID=A0A0B1T3B6_OESDE|nr:SH2 domain protein [Oesophagostomum dentatum]